MWRGEKVELGDIAADNSLFYISFFGVISILFQK